MMAAPKEAFKDFSVTDPVTLDEGSAGERYALSPSPHRGRRKPPSFRWLYAEQVEDLERSRSPEVPT